MSKSEILHKFVHVRGTKKCFIKKRFCPRTEDKIIIFVASCEICSL